MGRDGERAAVIDAQAGDNPVAWPRARARRPAGQHAEPGVGHTVAHGAAPRRAGSLGPSGAAPVMPFEDLHAYVAIPRVTGLRLSPDGTWLAATVQQPDPDGKKFCTSIWRIPASGPDGPPPSGVPAQLTRLTQSAQGEDGPAFLPDGSLVFASTRPDPAAGSASKKDGQEDGAMPALWLLPAAGGDARRIAAPPGGAGGIVTARRAPALMFMSA